MSSQGETSVLQLLSLSQQALTVTLAHRYNTWQILENAAGVVGSKTDVTNQFDAAVTYDFTVVRLFAFGTEAGFGLQTAKVCLV